MKNDQEKRLIKLLVVACMVILGLVSALIAILVIELSGIKKDNLSLHNLINGIQLQNGEDGKDGYTPIKGVDYFDGKDGRDGVDGRDGRDGADGYTPVKGVDYFDGAPGVQGEQGEQGDTGEAGPPGKTVFTRQNPLTGEYECRYAGDDIWQPESECT